jgi:phosphoglycolate phosphatase-like HAD superfamily hydrolase
MTAARLVLFDIDGTLLVSQGRGLRAMGEAFQQVFRRPHRPVAVLPHGKTDPVLFEELAVIYEVSRIELEASLAALHAAYAARLALLLQEPQAVRLEPGIPRLLELLAQRPGVRLGVVSGNLERTAWLKLEAAGLVQFFAAGAFGSEARERSSLVALAIERLSPAGGCWPPERVWVIGDTPEDVAAGRANGTRTLAVATGRHAVEELVLSGAEVVLPDLAESDKVVDILCDRR